MQSSFPEKYSDIKILSSSKNKMITFSKINQQPHDSLQLEKLQVVKQFYDITSQKSTMKKEIEFVPRFFLKKSSKTSFSKNYIKLSTTRNTYIRKYSLAEYQDHMRLLISFLISRAQLTLNERIIFHDFYEEVDRMEYFWQVEDEFLYWLKHFDDMYQKSTIAPDLYGQLAGTFAENIFKKHRYVIEDGFNYNSILLELFRFQKNDSTVGFALKRYLQKQVACALCQDQLLELNADIHKLLECKPTPYAKQHYKDTYFGYFAGHPGIVLSNNVFFIETTYRITTPQNFYYNKNKEKTNYISHIYNIIHPIAELLLATKYLFSSKNLKDRPIAIILKFLQSMHQQIIEYTEILNGLLSSLLSIVAEKFKALILYQYTLTEEEKEIKKEKQKEIKILCEKATKQLQNKNEEEQRKEEVGQQIQLKIGVKTENKEQAQQKVENHQDKQKKEGDSSEAQGKKEVVYPDVVPPREQQKKQQVSKKKSIEETEELYRKIIETIHIEWATLTEVVQNDDALDEIALKNIFPKVSGQIDEKVFKEVLGLFQMREQILNMLHHPDPYDKRQQNYHTRKARKPDQKLIEEKLDEKEENRKDEKNQKSISKAGKWKRNEQYIIEVIQNQGREKKEKGVEEKEFKEKEVQENNQKVLEKVEKTQKPSKVLDIYTIFNETFFISSPENSKDPKCQSPQQLLQQIPKEDKK